MTRYLLDSSVLIDHSRGIGRVVSTIEDWTVAGDEIGIGPVQVAEFFAGVKPSEWRDATTYLRSFVFWPTSAVVARRAGAYRYQFARRGIQLSTPDVMIAALARSLGATLVTGNVRDFPMTDITVFAV